MRPVSDAFLRTVRSSHKALYRATVCETFQTGTTPTGTRIGILPGSDVVLDGTAEVRGTLQLVTTGFHKWPTRGDSLLTPYGNEIYVERGIQYSDDSAEMVGLGYFRIDEPEQEDAPDGPIVLAGSDRMAGIVEAQFLRPRQWGAGTALGDIVDELILEIYPSATIEWDDDTDTVLLVRDILEKRERYQLLDDLIRAHAKVWYWDHRGVLVIRTAPDESEPVFDIECARGGGAVLGIQSSGVLTKLSRSLSRIGTRNAVVVNGMGPDTQTTPAFAVAIDANPESPTYFYGRFGQVPRFYTSQFITDDAQASSAARALLLQQAGLPYTVNLELTPNPALEPWDPVTVRAAAHEATERHVLAVLTIPLDASGPPMTSITRQKTVTLIGGV